jgi:Cu(I)/Ag(I) efflux system membrane fusion protein
MKNLFNICAILLVLSWASCTNSEKPVEASKDTVTHHQSHAVFTCPMHPEVISDKPGICPECKMDLVAKADGPSTSDSTVKEHQDKHQH